MQSYVRNDEASLPSLRPQLCRTKNMELCQFCPAPSRKIRHEYWYLCKSFQDGGIR